MTYCRLGAGVVTKSVDNALKLSNGLRAGTVYVNCYDVFDANTPFGGYKDSGVGRELGEPGKKKKTMVYLVHYYLIHDSFLSYQPILSLNHLCLFVFIVL